MLFIRLARLHTLDQNATLKLSKENFLQGKPGYTCPGDTHMPAELKFSLRERIRRSCQMRKGLLGSEKGCSTCTHAHSPWIQVRMSFSEQPR